MPVPDGIKLTRRWRNMPAGTILCGWSMMFATLCDQKIAERWTKTTEQDKGLVTATAPAPARTATRSKKRAIDVD